MSWLIWPAAFVLCVLCALGAIGNALFEDAPEAAEAMNPTDSPEPKEERSPENNRHYPVWLQGAIANSIDPFLVENDLIPHELKAHEKKGAQAHERPTH